jgi:hypothetical protein
MPSELRASVLREQLGKYKRGGAGMGPPLLLCHHRPRARLFDSRNQCVVALDPSLLAFGKHSFISA